MYKIFEKIEIIKEAILPKKVFINKEITDSIICSFYCNSCLSKTQFIIEPFKAGFPFYEIYFEEKVLSDKEILINRIASVTSKFALNYGAYTVNNLPTLYFGMDCNSCGLTHIVVFSYGEKQPGLEICQISGVWSFRKSKSSTYLK